MLSTRIVLIDTPSFISKKDTQNTEVIFVTLFDVLVKALETLPKSKVVFVWDKALQDSQFKQLEEDLSQAGVSFLKGRESPNNLIHSFIKDNPKTPIYLHTNSGFQTSFITKLVTLVDCRRTPCLFMDYYKFLDQNECEPVHYRILSTIRTGAIKIYGKDAWEKLKPLYLGIIPSFDDLKLIASYTKEELLLDDNVDRTTFINFLEASSRTIKKPVEVKYKVYEGRYAAEQFQTVIAKHVMSKVLTDPSRYASFLKPNKLVKIG